MAENNALWNWGNQQTYHEKIKQEIEKASTGGVTIDSELDVNSENPIQNKVVAEALQNVDADTLDGLHAASFMQKLTTAPINDSFTNDRAVNDTNGKALYREFIRKSADSTAVNRYYRVYSPNGSSYCDLQVTNTDTASTWNIAGSGIGTVNLMVKGQAVLTNANKQNNQSVSALGWADTTTGINLIPTLNTIAFWNGAYASTTSNLTYCKHGAFGTMATRNYSSGTGEATTANCPVGALYGQYS